jgi:hypothetical protein
MTDDPRLSEGRDETGMEGFNHFSIYLVSKFNEITYDFHQGIKPIIKT